MSDASPTRNPRFCGSCGSALAPGSKFCETCGTPAVAAAAQPAPVYAYPPAYPAPQTAVRSPLTRWIMIGAAALVVIVVAIIAISALSGGGGSGPSLNQVKTAKFMTGSIDKIIRSEKCTLTDVDKSRGYERKWVVSYRSSGKYSMVFTDAFVYDGYQWERYIQAYPKTGCPDIE